MVSEAGEKQQLAGVVGFFDDPKLLIHATEKVRIAPYQHFDCYTPYPVHGLEAAQGLKRSPLPYVTLAAGLTGCALAFLLQYWTSAVDWPLIVGGKPLNSWPAFVPIMFELTVLFGGLATFAALLIFCGLPNIRRRIFDTSITRDRFAIVIEANVPEEEEETEDVVQKVAIHKETGKPFKKFNESEAQEFLRRVGAKEVRSVYTEGWF